MSAVSSNCQLQGQQQHSRERHDSQNDLFSANNANNDRQSINGNYHASHGNFLLERGMLRNRQQQRLPAGSRHGPSSSFNDAARYMDDDNERLPYSIPPEVLNADRDFKHNNKPTLLSKQRDSINMYDNNNAGPTASDFSITNSENQNLPILDHHSSSTFTATTAAAVPNVRTQHWPEHHVHYLYSDTAYIPANESSLLYDGESPNDDDEAAAASTPHTMNVGWEGSEIEMSIIAGVALFGILANILVLLAMCRYTRSHSMIGYFLISLAVSDLVVATVICTPFVWAAHYGGYQPFGLYTNLACRVTCYFQFAMFTVQVYSIAWLSVDRYLAIRKPQRYESIQTRTRCQCWVIFTWLTAVFLCSPMLFSGYGRFTPDQQGHFIYDGTIKMCSISAATSSVYATTLFVLVLVPSVLTMAYCFYHIVCEMKTIREELKETNGQVTMASENLRNPEHKIAFILPAVAVAAWLPWTMNELLELVSGQRFSNQYAQFALTWFAISACCWRLGIYFAINRRFRKALCRGLKFCCFKCRCCRKADEEIGILD